MKIAIVGYYGCDNLGDELNLQEVIRSIKCQYPDTDITVLTDALDTLWKQPDYKLQIGISHDALNTFDLVIVGGGGLIYLGDNYFQCFKYLKVPYIFNRVGIDDRQVEPKAVSELKEILSNAASFTVRTNGDRRLAEKYLGLHPPVVPEAIWNYISVPAQYPSSPNILVDLNIYGDSFSDEIRHGLSGLTDANIWVLSAQSTSTDFYYTIKATPHSRIIIPDIISLNEKASYIAAADLVITSRLHVGLLAASHGKMVMMPPSTPKVKFFLESIGLSECTDFSTEEILKSLKRRIPWDSLEPIKKAAQANIIPDQR